MIFDELTFANSTGSCVDIHTHMDHTLLTDAPDRSVFYVCVFFHC